MKSRVFLGSLLAGAIVLCSPTAGEQPRPSEFDDLKPVNQLREKKPERPLADLADRLRKMIKLQSAISDGTRALHEVIQSLPDKKPRPEEQQTARQLAATEHDIIRAATKAIHE